MTSDIKDIWLRGSGCVVATSLDDLKPLAKVFSGANLEKVEKDRAYIYDFEEVKVYQLSDLYELIKEISSNNYQAILRAEMKAGKNAYMERRTIRRENATLKEGQRYWLMIDVDDWRIDDRRPLADEIERYIREVLPEAFQQADYIYQLSASQGLSPNLLNVHLYYWNNIPVSDTDIKGELKALIDKKLIDPAIYSGHQLHFTSPGSYINGATKPEYPIEPIGYISKGIPMNNPLIRRAPKVSTTNKKAPAIQTLEQLVTKHGSQSHQVKQRVDMTSQEYHQSLSIKNTGQLHHPDLLRYLSACQNIGVPQHISKMACQQMKDISSSFNYTGALRSIGGAGNQCGYPTLRSFE